MYYQTTELYHHGIKGMKWGVRHDKKPTYRSTGFRSAIARSKNEKVDASFRNWKENSKKREDAIYLGKKANQAKMDWERNRSDKSLRSAYRQSSHEYKKALRSNTTYRKGQVKHEVGSDLSRKYLSEAKKVGKQLTANPGDRKLRKSYNKLMSAHDVERAKARRAPEVAANRSKVKAKIKRTMTITAKAAAASAAVAGGAYLANKYLSNHNVTLNGNPVRVNSDVIDKFNKAVRAGKKLFKYI